MKKNYLKLKNRCLNLALVTSLAFGLETLNAQPGYITGDFHQHTTFTDGSWSLNHVMNKNRNYGLDWWANSEHGGGFNRNGLASGIDLDTVVYWDEMTFNPIAGLVAMSGGHQVMWRWQSLKDYSFPALQNMRKTFQSKTLFQGYEMNVPGHEHGSVCIIGGQFRKKKAGIYALSEFEYKFDNSDADTIGGAAMGWTKSKKNGHEKTLEAIDWCQNNYYGGSWIIPAHPERKKQYTIAHFRDMNDAGPDVCFGFESMPGHQKDPSRGGYSTSAFGGTYGGTGYFSAKIGGLWDAMLSEGRNWWLFASSDFHDTDGDFYPGEYQKIYTYTNGSVKPEKIWKGLHSGNSWVVEGNLIDYLQFNIITSVGKFNMGQTAPLNDKTITITITVRDPQTPNFNKYSTYNMPELDHIDLIAGHVHDKYGKDDSLYAVDNINTTRVIARFDAAGGILDDNGLISTPWKDKGNGFKEMKIILKNINSKMYFRLRGTNLATGTENETDGAGNPMADALMGANDAEKAFADLWFYSNPIFISPVELKKKKSTDEPIEEEPTNDFSIYPNPVNEFLVIGNPSNSTISVSVLNLSGSELKRKNSDGSSVQIDINDLDAGLYLVKIQTTNSTKIFKVVKE